MRRRHVVPPSGKHTAQFLENMGVKVGGEEHVRQLHGEAINEIRMWELLQDK